MNRTLRWAGGLLAAVTVASLGFTAPAQAATVSVPLRTLVADLPDRKSVV